MITKEENERLKRLYKRLEWLRTRIYQTEGVGNTLSHDRAEASALEWAIDIVEKSLKLKEKECYHSWSFWKEDRVFCSKCLKTNVVK